jgi:dihydrofolate reductase (trimethoprim resistance protein)
MKITMIAAMANNRVIGNGPDIPWKVTGEQSIFKRMTVGKTLLVGRTTFESMGPLPDRQIIVVSRKKFLPPEGTPGNVRMFPSIHSAIYWAKHVAKLDELIIAGGGSVYESFMPYADDLFLTTIDLAPEGDVSFPEIPSDFMKVYTAEKETNERFTITWYRRHRPLSESPDERGTTAA